MYTCANGPHCWVSCILICIGWLLVSSGLLLLTWNKVIATITKVKTVKFGQALLFITTVCVLCAPRYYMKSRHCCHEGKGQCPYEHAETK
jgi:hypothetical protein